MEATIMDANKVIQTFMELVRIDSETRFEAEIGEDYQTVAAFRFRCGV
jgi:hypothetical protein